MLDIYKKLFKRKFEAVHVYPDGREVCSSNQKGYAEYIRRRDLMALRQKGLCDLCGEWMKPDDLTFDHEDGRGMGGGKSGANRDDRIEIPDVNGDLQPYNSAVHWVCNSKKSSVRLKNYQPKGFKEVA